MSASTRNRVLLALGACVALVACAPRRAAPPSTPAPAAAEATEHVHAAPASPAAPMLTAQLAEGKRLFEAVCSACHTVNPPPAKAPPMSHVAMRYRRMNGSDSAAIARIVAFVPAPSAERSLMPAMARERFGLMPPLALPAEQLRAVAAYVLTLADTGMRHGGGGHGRH